MNSIIKIVQLTDLHICPYQDAEMQGEKPYNNLQRVIHSVMENKPDLILLTGDIAEDGSVGSYRLVGESVAKLNIPIYAIPGNHDNFIAMTKFLPQFKIQLARTLALNDCWHVIFLNSSVPNEHWGFLDENELFFLD